MRSYEGSDLITVVDTYKDVGLTNREIADRLGLTIGQFSGKYYRAVAERNGGAPATSKPFEIDYGKPLQLKGDAVVVGDVHVPFTDYDFCQNVNAIGKRFGVRRLIIAGDLFNMDAFSRYDTVVKLPTWAEERDACRVLFREWFEYFTEIVFIMGNHDRRLQKWTMGAFDERDLIGMVMFDDDLVQHGDKITASNFGWCTLDTPNGMWRITHPRNYSINQLTVADVLAQKYQMHICSHHEHHAAIGMDRYKRYITVNNGGLFDDRKMAYVHLDDSKSAGMAKAFTVIKGGFPYMFSDNFTDWDYWLDTTERVC